MESVLVHLRKLRVDLLLLFSLLGLMVFGATFILSAAMDQYEICLLYTSPSPRDATLSRMPSSA